MSNVGGQPVWSSDGRLLYYASAPRVDVIEPQAWQIQRVDLASGADEVAHELVARHVLLYGPEQDGQMGLLALNDDMVYPLHLLNLAGGELTFDPAWVTPLGWLK